MAPGQHASGSNFGASAPASTALESHPTVPVALPAPLCSCPPTPLSAMPVVTFTLTPQPGGEPGETQPGAEPGGQSPKLRSAGTPVNAGQADRPRCWIEPWRPVGCPAGSALRGDGRPGLSAPLPPGSLTEISGSWEPIENIAISSRNVLGTQIQSPEQACE